MWILWSKNIEPLSKSVPIAWFALEANERLDVKLKDLAEHVTDASRSWKSWNCQRRDTDR